MNSIGMKQKKFKNILRVNNKESLNNIINKQKQKKYPFKKEQTQINPSLLNKNNNFFQNIYQIQTNNCSNINPNINIQNTYSNKRIINSKKSFTNINSVDPRLIYCIKMLGITNYFSNFLQKNLNFEGLIALTNSDMSKMNIPKNIQQLIQNFILDYLKFGSLYSLDEIKKYFSYRKLSNNNNNKEGINKEKISFSYDYYFKNRTPRNNIINNINQNNNNLIQRKKMINNFLSQEDKNINNIKNRNKMKINKSNINSRMNKSFSPSHKNNLNTFSENINNLKNEQNNLNINDILVTDYRNNNNDYNNNYNTPIMKRNNSNNVYTIKMNRQQLISNISPINLTEIKPIQERNDLNKNLNDYLKYIKKSKNNIASNSQLIRKNNNLKMTKSTDNLNSNFYNNYCLNLKNTYNELYSEQFNKNKLNENQNYSNTNNNFYHTTSNLNLFENYEINDFYPEKNSQSSSYSNINAKGNNYLNINNNINNLINNFKLSKIKKLNENQTNEVINLMQNSERKKLNSNKNANKSKNQNNIKETTEKNRGMIMNNLNNYFIYNNFRDDNINKLKENLNIKNNNINNNKYYKNRNNINSRNNEKPILNKGNLLKRNKKTRDLFNIHMNKNLITNINNQNIFNNTQEIKIQNYNNEDIYELNNNNNNKNKFLDLLTSPLLNNKKQKINVDNDKIMQFNYFRKNQISKINNNRNLYDNGNIIQNKFNDFEFNNSNIILDKNYIHNKNNNEINYINETYSTNKTNKCSDDNSYNYYNLNKFSNNIKNLKSNIKNNLDFNRITQLQKYNKSFNESKNINNNIYDFNDFPINYSEGRNRKLCHSKVNNYIQDNNTKIDKNNSYIINFDKELFNKMKTNRVIQNNNYLKTQNNFYPYNPDNLITEFNYFQ